MTDNKREYIVLEHLNRYAKTLSGPDNEILSAENFLLAIVNILSGEPMPEYIPPISENMIKELSAICECYNISYRSTKEYLQSIIKEIHDPVYDEFKMDMLLEIADNIRKGYKCTYLSPVFLLEAILQSPTAHIKECKLSKKRHLVDNSLEHEIYIDLLEKSKVACNSDDSCATAEKFLWTLCDVLENLSEDDLGTPIKDVTCAILEKCEKVFDDHKISPKILKPLLADYIYNHQCETKDILTLSTYMAEASEASVKRRANYTSADMLLDAILKGHRDIQKDLFSMHDEQYKTQKDDRGDYLSDIDNYDNENDYFCNDTHDWILEDDIENSDIEATYEERNLEFQHSKFKFILSFVVNLSKKMQKELSSVVFGQDNAINTFVSGYYQARIRGITAGDVRKPYATFLFAGPPGVGKTFLAENIAKFLKKPFMRFDMSEYCDKESHFQFCGSNRVYKNAKSGNFTSFIENNPDCIVLFDEIEKAHPVIINLFLQMLDAGVIRDNFTDKELSLKNVIMIFTTNAGKQLYENDDIIDFSTTSRKVILKALQEDVNPSNNLPYFPAAICSRFASGNVIMFNHITAHNLLNIAKKEIESNASSFQKGSGINIIFDERVFAAILFAEGGNADARTIKSRSNAFFNNEFYELFKHLSSNNFSETTIGQIKNINIKVNLPDNQPEITELFEKQSKLKTLVFSSKHTANRLTNKTDACDFLCAKNLKEANEIMRKKDIAMIFIDLNQGANKNDEDYLNISDESSAARDFLQQLRFENSSIPIYILQTKKHSFTNEEKVTFSSQGIRGIIDLENNLSDGSITWICQNIHTQQSVINLARANKVITFETAQKLSDNNEDAEILLFDFKLKTAVDAGDSQNILNNVSKPDVKFSQVIGAEDAKQELAYFVEYLKDPKKYIGTGVKAPKGVLLYGPPGTGKTMLAKAMAGESDVTFICAEGNQFLKGTVGEGSKAIHDLFRTARKYAPTILFIDEIDAIAKERTGTGNAEDTLTALLTEMDGFKNQTAKPVFVLAATNFNIESGTQKSLDPALMRRFDRRIYVDLPDRDDRIKFMTMKIKSNSAFDISKEMIENLAVRSTGMSLASLDSVFEFSLRMVIRNKETIVTDAVLDEAFETFNNGEKRKWNSDTLLRTARHEAGHAVICSANGEIPSYITIVPRGEHGGYMQHNTDEDKFIFTKNELLSRIRTALGGRAAEIVYYGAENGVSTGAAGDLLKATSIARHMIEAYGMDESYGLAAFGLQDKMSSEKREAINKILVTEMNNAIDIIKANKKTIDKLSEILVNKNHLSGNEINKIFNKKTS